LSPRSGLWRSVAVEPNRRRSADIWLWDVDLVQ
jgi:hypothetical protein